MNTSYKFFIVLVGFAIAQAENIPSPKEFLKGAVAGAVSEITISFLRDSVLPDATKYELHKNYGVCRDQLTGQVKILAGAMGIPAIAAYSKKADLPSAKTLGARLVGIIAGASLACYVKKMIFPTETK